MEVHPACSAKTHRVGVSAVVLALIFVDVLIHFLGLSLPGLTSPTWNLAFKKHIENVTQSSKHAEPLKWIVAVGTCSCPCATLGRSTKIGKEALEWVVSAEEIVVHASTRRREEHAPNTSGAGFEEMLELQITLKKRLRLECSKQNEIRTVPEETETVELVEDHQDVHTCCNSPKR